MFGMFANQGFRKPGQPDPFVTPVSASLAPIPQIAAPKPSFFAQGGVGRGIAGALGDTLLGLAHQQPVYAPQMQQKRMMEREDQRYAQQEARLNKPQIVNLGNGGIARVGPDGQPEILREPSATQDASPIARDVEYFKSIGRDDLAEAYLQTKASPPRMVTDPSTGQVYMTQPGIPTARPQAKRPAIGAVVADPFGDGGPMPSASGSFR